LESI
jgi:dynein heavy chain, axonemal